MVAKGKKAGNPRVPSKKSKIPNRKPPIRTHPLKTSGGKASPVRKALARQEAASIIGKRLATATADKASGKNPAATAIPAIPIDDMLPIDEEHPSIAALTEQGREKGLPR